MELFEGAKVSSRLINAAMTEPAFTFGFEAEFYIVGAHKILRSILQSQETRGDEDYYVKKLKHLSWYDILRYFVPLGVQMDTDLENQELMMERLEKVFQEHVENPEPATHSVMYETLKRVFRPHEIMVMLQIFPETGFVGLPKSQEKTFEEIARDGDVEEIQPFGKLNELSFRTYPIGQEEEAYDLMANIANREILYEIFAKQFAVALGEHVTFSWSKASAIQASGGYSHWVITSDESLEEREAREHDTLGLELVSPPKQLLEGFQYMLRVFEILNDPPQSLQMKNIQVKTTQETGFHVNMGIGNKKVDYIKLLFLMGEKYVTAKFGRQLTDAAQRILPLLRKEIGRRKTATKVGWPAEATRTITTLERSLKADSQDVEAATNLLKSMIPTTRNVSMNTKKLREGYIEFRVIGNIDYHKRAQDIAEIVKRLAVMMYIATEPEIYRKEFLSKLYKFVADFIKTPQAQIADDKGVIGRGARGGYGVPAISGHNVAKNTADSPYDGEYWQHQYGFDPGSNTQ